jgi:hypothetical protein
MVLEFGFLQAHHEIKTRRISCAGWNCVREASDARQPGSGADWNSRRALCDFLVQAGIRRSKPEGAGARHRGDTIEIEGRRIRIFGIDAPEQDQTCERGGGGTWYCGAEATRLLGRMARSQIVDCRVRATDIYGRFVALCSVGDEDLGRAMVRSGFAISSSRNREYAAEENSARVGRLGIWSGAFQNPRDWRDAHRDPMRP